MAFASIYVPEFMVQAVLRVEPLLRHRAIALVDEPPPLWSVVAANRAARDAGIQIGMAKMEAAQFPGVEIHLHSRASEFAAHAALLDLGWSISPQVEDTCLDTIIVDLSGLNSLFGTEEDIARSLAERASSLELFPHIAIAANPEASLLAARGFSGITVIPTGMEPTRLATLPIHALQSTPELLEILGRWGIRTCGALAALPMLQLSERLGQEGVRLHQLARGASLRSLVLAHPTSTFQEEIELDDAVSDLEPLAFLLSRLLNQLCARLTARSLAAIAIHSHFDLEANGERNFDFRRNKKATKSYENFLRLPVPIRDPQVLLKLLRLQLQTDPPTSAILKITLSAEPARPRTMQSGLFLPPSPDPERLEVTIARLGNLVGASNIGSPELADTHRPGAFRMSRFNSSATANDGEKVRISVGEASLAFRVFRPPPAARVQLCDRKPARVEFRGLHGSVLAASGPWRTSGDWWQEDSWRQDEWDLEIRFSGTEPKRMNSGPAQAIYRFFYDYFRKTWFVRGIYD
jgi:protein ImuB